MNGAQAKNVYWVVTAGAIDIKDYSIFKGTMVANNEAVSLKIGTTVDGRVLTASGLFETFGITATSPALGINNVIVKNDKAMLFPNPFSSSFNINLKDASETNSSRIHLYNVLGGMVMDKIITRESTTVDINLPSGIYLYEIVSNNGAKQTGKLVSN